MIVRYDLVNLNKILLPEVPKHEISKNIGPIGSYDYIGGYKIWFNWSIPKGII